MIDFQPQALQGPSLAAHFRIAVGGKKIAYCYVRKNACSAFKRLFVAVSPHAQERQRGEDSYHFMRRFHRLGRNAALAPFDHVIFVYRDPAERALSLYKDKFIQRSGHAGLFESYARITGRPAETASFHDFVTRYLSPGFPELDKHALPQAWHLRAGTYTDAIAMADLPSAMAAIIGPQQASAIFGSRNNATSHIPASTDESGTAESAADAGAEDLREVFLRTGTMPDAPAMLTAALRARLGALYAEDDRLISLLPGHGTCRLRVLPPPARGE